MPEPASRKPPVDKPGLHPRNRHQGHYDFEQLVRTCPDLARFVSLNKYQAASIDFADPQAVKTLNRALLAHFYGVTEWDIPDGYLCPPIPGRADYIHLMADLLATGNGGEIPCGASVRGLDVGVGANCIYPIIGQREYGWHFLGTDIDPTALDSARRIVAAERNLAQAIELRLQTRQESIFRGLLQDGEDFDFCVCNPPFHASLAEAREGSTRKWKNLGKSSARGKPGVKAPLLNFGGQGAELWCPGGELAFVRRMIKESAHIPNRCLWFSSLVSKADNLPLVYQALREAGIKDGHTLEMSQGQKKSRVVAWTFLKRGQQESWRKQRSHVDPAL
ncbi:MAG: 23S rRNA (adenine(1618)-N(6))-methyltransferase RlmF [Zoogloea sp.]|nr:23S rRNA (adenine(1618)-N(6))-methyltransferase RlmF [Zoogloea sp.]